MSSGFKFSGGNDAGNEAGIGSSSRLPIGGKQMHRERQEHTKLKMNNVMICAENLRLRNLLGNTGCLTCDGPAAARDLSFNVHHLRTENALLKIEIVCKARSWCLPSSMGENGISSSNRELFTQINEDVEKEIIVQLAIYAMEEFLPMAQLIEPLWLPDAIDGNTNYILNEDEYFGSSSKHQRQGDPNSDGKPPVIQLL